MSTLTRSITAQTDPHEATLDALHAWRGQATFDALAHDVLERLLVLTEQRAVDDARCLRATMYMRPNDSYRAVVARQRVTIAEHEMLSSATMWRWVSDRGEPLLLDTTLGVLWPCRDEHSAMELDDPRDDDQPWTKNSSLVLLLERDATHILLLPIHDLRGVVCGMVSVEVSHDHAMGTLGIWADDGQRASMSLVELAAPFLFDRLGIGEPMSAEPDTESLQDEWLPVVGATMRGRLTILQAFAAQNETLLLTGETGVGKSRLARWCHARSARSDGPMEVLELAAVPEDMQIAHLMGWRRGAFTGAVEDVAGALTRAHGGTLFIDEVDKLSLETQASMLGLLETYTYQQLGGQEKHQADVRFIVGTNADLRELVNRGQFRADLYFRVCVLPVHVLSLEERADELMAWVRYMFVRALERAPVVEPEAVQLLSQAKWPGNLRQLDNVVRRVVAIMGIRGGDVVRGEDVRLAMGMAMPEASGAGVVFEEPLLDVMRAGAARYVALSRARVEQGFEAIDVELLEALRGLAYEEAFAVTEDVEQALSWLGKSGLMKSRNHQRTISRERKKIDALRDAILNKS